MVIGFSAGDVVDEQRACRSSVVASRHTSESFLAGRVPNLQFNELVAEVQDLGAKFNAYCVSCISLDCVLAKKKADNEKEEQRTKNKERRTKNEERKNEE